MRFIRIRFAADIVVDGETMADVKNNWTSIPLFSKEAIDNGVDFLEIEAVEDVETGEDVETELIKAYAQENDIFIDNH